MGLKVCIDTHSSENGCLVILWFLFGLITRSFPNKWHLCYRLLSVSLSMHSVNMLSDVKANIISQNNFKWPAGILVLLLKSLIKSFYQFLKALRCYLMTCTKHFVLPMRICAPAECAPSLTGCLSLLVLMSSLRPVAAGDVKLLEGRGQMCCCHG